MAVVELQAITQPVGIMRVMATVLTCLCFSLVASVGAVSNSYWAWCMFTWCFCFFFTFLIVILELTTVNTKLPFAWEDFTAAHAMLASLMIFSVSVIFPIFFTHLECELCSACSACRRLIGASIVSWVCVLVYTGEVVLTRLRPSGETSGFLSTVPGIFKMLETLLACLIFTSLAPVASPGLRWCVAVYCLCFIFSIIIILLSLGRLTTYFPFSFDKLVIVYNILATVMYITAMVIWPLYSESKLVAVTVLTILNCIVYILDTAYSIYLVFFISRE